MTENTFYDSKPELWCRTSHYMCCNSLHIITSLRTHQRRKKCSSVVFLSLILYASLRASKKRFSTSFLLQRCSKTLQSSLTIFLKISTDRQKQKNKSEKFGGFSVDSKKNFYDKLTCSFCAHKAEQQNSANIQIDWKKFRLEAARVKPFN